MIVDAHNRLQAASAALKSATAPVDASSPSGRLIFRMLASFAEYERETIRERTRAGLHRAYRGGRHLGAAPYGYRADENGYLQIVPEEAEPVHQSAYSGVHKVKKNGGKDVKSGRCQPYWTSRDFKNGLRPY